MSEFRFGERTLCTNPAGKSEPRLRRYQHESGIDDQEKHYDREHYPANKMNHPPHPQFQRQMLKDALPETGTLLPTEGPTTGPPLPGLFVTVEPANGRGW